MGSPSSSTIVITDRLLRSWIRCRRKAWLDRYGDKKKRIWLAHRTLQVDHQHRSFVELISQTYQPRIGTCEEGASFVLGLKLFGETPSGKSLGTNTSLIQKIEGISKFGGFCYRPVITRQGNKLTRELKLILTFNALLLEKLQETKINHAIAISKINQRLDIEKLRISPNLTNQVFESIERLSKDLDLDEPPPISSNKRKCSICTWKNVCKSTSISEGHLSEVSGLGGKRISMLKEIGINTLKDLAHSDPIKLKEDLKHPHNIIAPQIINQALIQLNKTKKRLKPYPALPELNELKGVFLYDIESDPDSKHDFLHGFIRLSRMNNGEWNLEEANYQPLLNLENNNEEFIWKRIKKKLAAHPSFPILHYGETESIYIYKLAQRNKCTESELNSIRNRFIDIHLRIKENWLLPINNYSLKTVANYIGFHWEQKGVDGSNALLWWRQWKYSRRSRKLPSNNLKQIFQYNKDDCLATWAIASWLIKNN